MKRFIIILPTLPALSNLPLLTGFILILSGCGTENSTQTTPTSGTLTSVYTSLKSNNCTECHVPGGAGTQAGAKLDFTSQTTAYSTLTTSKVSGTSGSTNCGTLSIVVASSPSTSYLTAVLFSSYSSSNFAGKSGCTPISTHQTQYNLTSSEQSSLINWIQNGALNN